MSEEVLSQPLLDGVHHHLSGMLYVFVDAHVSFLVCPFDRLDRGSASGALGAFLVPYISV